MRWCCPGPGAGRPTGRGPAGGHGSGGVGEGAGRKPRGPGELAAPHPRTRAQDTPSLAALHCSPRCWVGSGHQPQGPGLTLEVLPSRLADPKSPRSPPMSRPSTGLPTPTPVSPPSLRATCAGSLGDTRSPKGRSLEQVFSSCQYFRETALLLECSQEYD